MKVHLWKFSHSRPNYHTETVFQSEEEAMAAMAENSQMQCGDVVRESKHVRKIADQSGQIWEWRVDEAIYNVEHPHQKWLLVERHIKRDARHDDPGEIMGCVYEKRESAIETLTSQLGMYINSTYKDGLEYTFVRDGHGDVVFSTFEVGNVWKDKYIWTIRKLEV